MGSGRSQLPAPVRSPCSGGHGSNPARDKQFFRATFESGGTFRSKGGAHCTQVKITALVSGSKVDVIFAHVIISSVITQRTEPFSVKALLIPTYPSKCPCTKTFGSLLWCQV